MKTDETEAQIIDRINRRWGDTHEVTKVYGVYVDITTLPSGVSVVFGDGKTFHFQLKKKS